MVNTLAARTGWTVERALQFLKEKYESGKGSMSPRSFSDYLGKGKGGWIGGGAGRGRCIPIITTDFKL